MLARPFTWPTPLVETWMPDGRSVVVVDYGAAGGSALYRIDVESGRSIALTSPKEFLVGMPSVSPDGQLVAFAGQPNGGATYDQTKNQIWILPMGGRPYQVSAGQGRQPDWSPDGRWLAFTSNRGDSTGRHAVFVVDRTGRNLIQLTDHFPNAQHPVWSPVARGCCFRQRQRSEVGCLGSRESPFRSCRSNRPPNMAMDLTSHDWLSRPARRRSSPDR